MVNKMINNISNQQKNEERDKKAVDQFNKRFLQDYENDIKTNDYSKIIQISKANRERLTKKRKKRLDDLILRTAKIGEDKEIIELALQGADINASDEYGRTPGHLAAENGHPEYLDVYEKLGGDMCAVDTNGNSVIGLIYKDLVINKVSFDEFKAYLNKIDINANEFNMKDIEDYIKNKEYSKIKRINKENRRKLNDMQKMILDELILKAAERWDPDNKAIVYFVLLGGNINARNEDDKTAGHIAAVKGDLECLEGYEELGGDMYAVDNNGDSVIGLKYRKGKLSVDNLISYLNEIGININKYTMAYIDNYLKNNEYTEIRRISKENRKKLSEKQKKILDELILKAAERRHANKAMIYFVLLGGDINARDIYGWTAGHYIVGGLNTHPSYLEIYFNLGGNPLAVNKRGENVIGLVYEKGLLSLDEVILCLNKVRININKFTKSNVENYMMNEEYSEINKISENNREILDEEQRKILDGLILSAARKGDEKAMAYFVLLGGDINARDNEGRIAVLHEIIETARRHHAFDRDISNYSKCLDVYIKLEGNMFNVDNHGNNIISLATDIIGSYELRNYLLSDNIVKSFLNELIQILRFEKEKIIEYNDRERIDKKISLYIDLKKNLENARNYLYMMEGLIPTKSSWE